jgi:hypothetical protein
LLTQLNDKKRSSTLLPDLRHPFVVNSFLFPVCSHRTQSVIYNLSLPLGFRLFFKPSSSSVSDSHGPLSISFSRRLDALHRITVVSALAHIRHSSGAAIAVAEDILAAAAAAAAAVARVRFVNGSVPQGRKPDCRGGEARTDGHPDARFWRLRPIIAFSRVRAHYMHGYMLGLALNHGHAYRTGELDVLPRFF